MQSYVDVPTEDGINTVQFLEATEGLIKLFGKPYLLCPAHEWFCQLGRAGPHLALTSWALINPLAVLPRRIFRCSRQLGLRRRPERHDRQRRRKRRLIMSSRPGRLPPRLHVQQPLRTPLSPGTRRPPCPLARAAGPRWWLQTG